MNQQKPKVEIRQNRHFSEEFRRRKVKALWARQVAIPRLCRLYKVSSKKLRKASCLRRRREHSEAQYNC